MTDDLRAVVVEELGRIAPEADLTALDPDDDVREALDIDSMDLSNLVIALHERLDIDIPERDVGELTTLRRAVAYLAGRRRGAE